MVSLIASEEQIDQFTFDQTRKLEVYNYLYEKVGFKDAVDLEVYKQKIR